MEIKYFKSWAGYSIPFKPVNEISREEAIQLKSYYLATYKNSIMISFEKILDKQREWIDHYSYDDKTGKILERVLHKSDGSISKQKFDKKGKLLKNK